MSSTMDRSSDSENANSGAPTISVIMPVYNGRDYIVESLPPLIAMRDRGAVLEVIVANDGSTDGTDDLAEKLGATVIQIPGPLGPGAARNVAVDMAKGELAWFVDADVVVPQETADNIADVFDDDSIVAAFGSYDDSPPGKNFSSQYKNLVHHYYHHQSGRDASTFWAGCGIVRRAAFRAISGFDVKRYRRPAIEDIELGYRLRAAGGRIVLEPKLLCKHLKIWTLRSVISTDFFQRALPWSRLMLSRGGLIDDLNVGKAERIRAALAGLLALSAGAPVAGPEYLGVFGAMMLVVAVANRNLFALFTRRNGVFFGLGGLLFHQVYYLYSSVAYVWCWLEQRFAPMEPTPARSGVKG